MNTGTIPFVNSNQSGKAEEILARVPDPVLREDVSHALQLAFQALASLQRVHLPQDHFEEGATARPDDDQYVELAPYVLEAISSINQLLNFVSQKFSTPAQQNNSRNDDEFDLEFDLVDGPTGDGVGLSQPKTGKRFLNPREQVDDAMAAYAGMLRSRVLDLGKRLRFATGKRSGWQILAELDDAHHRLEKALQAVVFGVLGVFASDVRREEILPAYRSAVTEAVALRAAIAELSHHIARLSTAMSSASPDNAVPLVVAVADHLARFSIRPEYRTLRAEDKKATIDFRTTLHSLRHRKQGLPLPALRQALEGYSKFLEAMHAINHREVLILHDRQRLKDALVNLENLAIVEVAPPADAVNRFRQFLESLDVLVGRNPELDHARREVLASPPSDSIGLAEFMHWKQLLETTLAAVG